MRQGCARLHRPSVSATAEALEPRRLLAAISSGQTLTGTINPAGQTDTYTFTANAGDAVSVTLGDAANTSFDPHLQLFGPNGSLVAEDAANVGAEVDLLDLAQSGTYTIAARDLGDDNTGSYAVTMVRVPGAQVVDADSGPITTNQRRTGTISVGDMDVYTFTAAAGDTVSVTLADTANTSFDPLLRVFAPDGSLAGQDTANVGAELDLSDLAQGGTYYVVARDLGDDNTGSYALSFVRVPGAQPTDADSGPITTGQRRTGTIDVGDLDVYTFSAGAGDAVSVTLADTGNTSFDPLLRVFAPDGSLVREDTANVGAEADLFDLTQAGTYTVVVRDLGDDNTGAYALTFARLPGAQVVDADSGPLVSGQRRAGTIDVGDLDIYTFTADPGDSVSVLFADAANTSFDPLLRVFGPDGALLREDAANVGAEADAFELAVGGTYYVVVRDLGDDNTGSYALTFVRVPAAQPAEGDSGPIQSGQRRTGTIDVGDLDVYTFAASAGESAVVLLGDAENTSFDPHLRVFAPGGSPVGEDAANVGAGLDLLDLPQTGTYTVVVRDLGDDNTGTYALSLAKLPGAQQPDTLDNDGGTLPGGQSRSGAVTPGDLDVYTFTLAAGASATVRLTDLLNTSFDPRLDVFGPNGVRIDNDSGNTAAVVNLTNAAGGTYYALARDSGDDNVGSYAISLNAAAAPDTRSPQVTRSRFLFDTPQQRLVFTLNESVAGTVQTGDLALRNLTTNTDVPTANLSVTFNPWANEITFQFPGYPGGVLPNGNYRATLPAGSQLDAAGNPTVAAAVFEFYVLAGDTNRDRVVNLADFGRLRQNFGGRAKVFSEGDLNYDGLVNLADFGILRANFGRRL